MPYAYEGLATVTVLALYADQPPVELTTMELPIVLKMSGATAHASSLATTCRAPKRPMCYASNCQVDGCCTARSSPGSTSPGGAGWNLRSSNTTWCEHRSPIALTGNGYE
ncbi:hypothetical protein PS874_06423 [Pseudomonas fluorescens]|nr:hypothetical protein PS874_06423 [Pseudomonas fluorescens]